MNLLLEFPQFFNLNLSLEFPQSFDCSHILGENRFGDEGLFFHNNHSAFKPSIGLANAIRFVNQCRQQWELDQGIWKDTPPCIDFYLKCQTDQMFGEELDHMHSHHHPKQFLQLTVFIWKILQGLETAALTLIFDLLRLIVLSEHLLAPVSRSQNPTGSLQNLLFHFRTAMCFKKWLKCTVQCALQCILFCQLAKPFISLKN